MQLGSLYTRKTCLFNSQGISKEDTIGKYKHLITGFQIYIDRTELIACTINHLKSKIEITRGLFGLQTQQKDLLLSAPKISIPRFSISLKAFVAGWGASSGENCLTDSSGPSIHVKCNFPFEHEGNTFKTCSFAPTPSGSDPICKSFNECKLHRA